MKQSCNCRVKPQVKPRVMPRVTPLHVPANVTHEQITNVVEALENARYLFPASSTMRMQMDAALAPFIAADEGGRAA